jgi:HPt (histidine-containing phosphotransfer) domain-containing protein
MIHLHQWDLVLMDMYMPVMDGVAATQAIRLLDGFDTLPIIALTANARQSDLDRCLQAGMNDYVLKPINPDELSQVLLRWIQARVVDSTRDGELPIQTKEWIAQRRRDRPDGITAQSELPVNIVGLDVSLGLTRTLGKVPLYLSIVRKFIQQQSLFSESFNQALGSGNVGEAERLVHTLQSTASNIGAMPLASEAARLEERLRLGESAEMVGADTERLLGGLTKLLEQLKESVWSAPEFGRGQVDQAEFETVCLDLLLSLKNDDVAALKVFRAHHDLLKLTLRTDFLVLQKMIESYDFSAAHGLLLKLCQQQLVEIPVKSLRGQHEQE